MSTLILLPLFFSYFAFLACACCGSDLCSLFGCRTSVRACIPPQKCSLREGPWGLWQPPCPQQEKVKTLLQPLEHPPLFRSRNRVDVGQSRIRGLPRLFHVDIVISGDKPWGWCLWQILRRSERRNGHVGFYSCIVSSSGEESTSLLSA